MEQNKQNEQNRQHEEQIEQTQRLAQWLLEVMQPSSPPGDETLELTPQSGYHPHFFFQIPDFASALLNNDSQAATHYAPLLYHMVSCRVCHENFLEVYDAMREALYPQRARPILGQGTRTLAAMPPRMLEHLCQVWISQAEAVLRQARRDGTNQDATARLLLQEAISLSTHIAQYNVRRDALQDLVRVATLFDERAPDQQVSRQAAYSYTPVLAPRQPVLRRAETPARTKDMVPEPLPLVLQASVPGGSVIRGAVTQQRQTLLLSLQDLDASLRGSPIIVSIRLGSLFEPIHWTGGNPFAIRSTVPVDASGTLTLVLGETELRLDVPEERNMLEATFLLVEVRGVGV